MSEQIFPFAYNVEPAPILPRSPCRCRDMARCCRCTARCGPAAFTALSLVSAATVPISTYTREARAPFQKPEDLVEIAIRRHECDYLQGVSSTTESISCPGWKSPGLSRYPSTSLPSLPVSTFRFRHVLQNLITTPLSLLPRINHIPIFTRDDFDSGRVHHLI